MYDLNTTAYWRKAKAVVLAVFFFGACEGCEPTIVEPEYDACPNLEGAQPTIPRGMVLDAHGNCVPEPSNIVLPVIELPKSDTLYITGRSIPCKVSVTQENAPIGSATADTLFLNGERIRCVEIGGQSPIVPQLMKVEPFEPVGKTLAPGEHTLRYKSCNTKTGVCGTAEVRFRIAEWPSKIVYSWVRAPYPGSTPRVFCIVDDDGGGQPDCQTQDGWRYWPMLTPDGQSWVYSKLDFSGLWFSERDGSGERVVSTKYQGISHTVEFPVFSPSGQKIAFVGGASNDQGFYAFVMNVDGTDITPVHGDCGGFGVPYIVWLNEHEVVIGCTQLVGGITMSEYRKVNILSGEHKRLQFFPRFGHEASGARILDASADGSVALLWTVFTDKRVVLLKTDGSGEYTKITPPTPNGRLDDPFFCQGGRAICYAYGPALFAMDLDGGNGREILRLPFGWIETARRWK